MFKLDTKGKETVLHKFTGRADDGAFPEAGLVADAHGNLYGTTAEGGGTGCLGIGCGTIFKVTGSKETVQYIFRGSPDDGSYPDATLYADAAGNFYGTTEYGGNAACQPLGCGAVFKLDSAGQEKLLHLFDSSTDGGAPLAPVIRDAKGNLYGTTSNWGPSSCDEYGCGTVFKLTP